MEKDKLITVIDNISLLNTMFDIMEEYMKKTNSKEEYKYLIIINNIYIINEEIILYNVK